MTGTVFISHAPEDPAAALAAAAWGARGIRCRTREAEPGAGAGSGVPDDGSVLVALLSGRLNGPPEVLRDLADASRRGIPVLLFQTDEARLSREVIEALQGGLGNDWHVRAVPAPLEDHLPGFAELVLQALAAAPPPRAEAGEGSEARSAGEPGAAQAGEAVIPTPARPAAGSGAIQEDVLARWLSAPPPHEDVEPAQEDLGGWDLDSALLGSPTSPSRSVRTGSPSTPELLTETASPPPPPVAADERQPGDERAAEEPDAYAGREDRADGPLRLAVSVGRRSIEQVIQGEALIGRPDPTRGIYPEIDLRLDDAVSRRHARILVRNGRYVLSDLRSTNGTRFNRQPLEPETEVPLRAGDEIEVGELTLIRVLEAP